jgi:hypothetical protein
MNETKRPELLEALCRLSFAGSGIGFLLYAGMALFFHQTDKIITNLTNITETEKLSSAYFLFFSLFFGVSFLGVLRMWKLKRSGFFLYLAAQVAIVIYPLLQLGQEAFSSVSLIFSVLFVVMYAAQFFRKRYQSLEK